MKVSLRILCQKDAVAALARDPEVARTCDLSATVFDLAADSPIFARLLELTTSTSGAWLNPVTEFTSAELSSVRFFQLEGRKLVREGPGDYDINIARLRARPVIRSGPFRIRLLDSLALSKVTLRPNEVACAGDWTAEFIVSRAVGRIFADEGLEGFALRPVTSPRSNLAHPDVALLYTEALLPQAVLDVTTPVHPDEEGGHSELGCLSYDFSAGLPTGDFFRTGENWSSNQMPVWVVSGRVRDVFRRHKLRGWAFRPVLEIGTPLHASYLATWRDLMGRVAASNPKHFF